MAPFCEGPLAVQFTVVVPGGNVDPEEGTQETLTMLPQLFVAETLNVTGAPAELWQGTTIFVGQRISMHGGTCATPDDTMRLRLRAERGRNLALIITWFATTIHPGVIPAEENPIETRSYDAPHSRASDLMRRPNLRAFGVSKRPRDAQALF